MRKRNRTYARRTFRSSRGEQMPSNNHNGNHDHTPSEPILVGDSSILPISQPKPNYWTRSASEQEQKRVFTPGGTYRREKFPALESFFDEWR